MRIRPLKRIEQRQKLVRNIGSALILFWTTVFLVTAVIAIMAVLAAFTIIFIIP